MDEIPDPIVLGSFIKYDKSPNVFFNLKQDFYYYNLVYMVDNYIWRFAKAISYQEYLRQGSSPHKIRGTLAPTTIDKAGWHLSYFGDANFISNKIKNFGHQEFNTDEITDEGNIAKKLKSGEDILNRYEIKLTKISVRDNKYLPPKYLEYLSKFINDTS